MYCKCTFECVYVPCGDVWFSLRNFHQLEWDWCKKILQHRSFIVVERRRLKYIYISHTTTDIKLSDWMFVNIWKMRARTNRKCIQTIEENAQSANSSSNNHKAHRIKDKKPHTNTWIITNRMKARLWIDESVRDDWKTRLPYIIEYNQMLWTMWCNCDTQKLKNFGIPRRYTMRKREEMRARVRAS